MKYTFGFCFIILSAVSLTSCGALFIKEVETRVTKQNGSIPPEFGKDTLTLICVIYGKNSYDRYMKKHVTNEYHGKYEFVLKDSIHNSRYYDQGKYRYIFDTKISETSATYYPNGNTQAGSMSGAYYFLDRFNGKKYESAVSSSLFAKLIQAYMIILEKERLKYHPNMGAGIN